MIVNFLGDGKFIKTVVSHAKYPKGCIGEEQTQVNITLTKEFIDLINSMEHQIVELKKEINEIKWRMK